MMPGTLEMQVQGPTGEHTIDDNYVMQSLAKMGEQVVGRSADGQTLTLQDDQGTFELPVADAIQKMGYQVKSVRPTAPDESGVDFETRFAVSNLADEDMKKAYLETKLRRQGIANPQIMGSGRDWFTFDPQSNQWKALTNKANWDVSDIAEALPAAAKGITSAVGGTVGMAGGVPGMAVGAAAGNALADAGMRGALYGLDPDYKAVSTLGQHLKEIGVDSAVAGGTAGVLGGAAKYLGPAVRGLVTSGPVSTAGRAIGGAGQAVSSGVGKAAGFMAGGPLRQDVAASFIPGVMNAQLAGLGAELPQMAMTGGVSALGKAATSGPVKAVLGEETSQNLGRGIESLLAKRGGDPLRTLNDVLRSGKPAAEIPPTARDVGGNIGEKLARWFGRDPSAVGRAAEETQSRAAMEAADALAAEHPELADAIYQGAESQEPFAQQMGQRAAEDATRENAVRSQKWGGIGETFGQGVENLGRAGQNLNRAIRGGTMLGLRGAQGAAAAAKPAFSALHKASMLAQPYENYLWLNQGLRPLAEEQVSRRFPWKKRQVSGNLLANQ
jgi:hypothetical protein